MSRMLTGSTQTIKTNHETMARVRQQCDLPVGIHPATLAEVVEHFGISTLQRRVIAQWLARIYELACSTGQLARFVIFGKTGASLPLLSGEGRGEGKMVKVQRIADS